MERLGTAVGQFRIVAAIGQGGLGTVYEAFDEKLKRRVALKELHLDPLEQEARARFLREARILSRLDDPRICRIYDYLERPDGDFLVLELIEGRALDSFLPAGEPMPLAQVLHIGERIAGALVRAHAEGIVHRDLKPANVMLTHGGDIKVLDFGLAFTPARTGDAPPPPSIEEDAARTSFVHTRAGRVLGTLSYMSPEQATGEGATPASDMYSLGLILQELLSGQRAYPRNLPSAALFLAVARGQALPLTGVDAATTRLIDRLKSLKPEDRPTSSETLAALAARRERPRRRLRWAAATAAALTLIGLAGKYTWDLRRERNIAREAQRSAEVARRAAEEVTNFLVGIFEVNDPSSARGRSVTARELLERGAQRIDRQLAGQPLVQARMQVAIGRVHRELGLLDEAERLLRAALASQRAELGEWDPALAATLEALAGVDESRGRFEEAIAFCNQALAIYREAELVEEEANGLNMLGEIYRHRGDLAAAKDFYEQGLGLLTGIPADRVRDKLLEATLLNNMAAMAWEADDLAGAERLLDRVAEVEAERLGPDHPRLARALNNRGLIAIERRDFPLAEDLFRRSLAIKEKVLGAAHPDLASTLFNLGNSLLNSGQPAEAEHLFRRALAIDEAAAGDASPRTAASLNGLGSALSDQSRYDEANVIFQRALEIFDRVAPNHPARHDTLLQWAKVARKRNDLELAHRLEAARR
jgi:tetratricopeptide (TPR) repeat protein/tRNA A-37 threonylcarbamoyl transferase component Bud32